MESNKAVAFAFGDYKYNRKARFIPIHLTSVIIIILTVFSELSFVSAAKVNPNPAGGTSTLPRLAPVTLEVPESLKGTPPFNDSKLTLTVPAGFGVKVVARVFGARFALALPTGDVLVSQPKSGKVSFVNLAGQGNAVGANVSDFITGLIMPHGLVYHADKNGKKHIYISESTRVVRYPYNDGDQKAGRPEVMASDLPAGGGNDKKKFRHPLKNIAVAENGTLYVSIGSETNDDVEDLKKDPKRGAIYAYSSKGAQKSLVSEGVRNAEGLAFAPNSQELWVVVNQRDNVLYGLSDSSRNYGKVIANYVDNNPPEEFVHLYQGINYGWPYCNPVSSASMDNLQYIADVANNPNETVVKCSTFRKVDKGIEAHTAPLGLGFWTGDKAPSQFKNGAIVGLHGSWNRQRLNGHKVVFFPWLNNRPGKPYDLVSGWATDAIKKSRWGRPVDTAALPDGSLLITDDYSGTLYKLYKK